MNQRNQRGRSRILRLFALMPAIALVGCGQVSVFGRTIGEPQSAAMPPSQSSASNEMHTGQSSKPSEPTPAVLKLKGVSLSLTAEAAAKTSSDSKFNVDALRVAIENELKSRLVLDDSDSSSLVGEVRIDRYELQPTTNAVIFGQIINTGILSGSLRVRDAQGNELGNHRVEAKTQVTYSAKGDGAIPLASLYGKFAQEAGDLLAGKVYRPEDNSWRPR